MSKYATIIIVVIAIILTGFGFKLVNNRAISPTSSEFIGTITSAQNRVLTMKGLYTALNQKSPGVLVGREITVTITPDTKIYKQTNTNGMIDKKAITFQDLQADLQRGPIVLAKVGAVGNVYNQPHIVAVELVYTTQTGPGGVLK